MTLFSFSKASTGAVDGCCSTATGPHGGPGRNCPEEYGGIAPAATMGDGVSIRFGILNPTGVGAAVCVELCAAVRADQPKVFRMVVLRIPIDVVEDKLDRSGLPRHVLSV